MTDDDGLDSVSYGAQEAARLILGLRGTPISPELLAMVLTQAHAAGKIAGIQRLQGMLPQ